MNPPPRDPLTVPCRACESRAGVPCSWPRFIRPTSPPPLYHPEREADSE